MEHTLVAVFDRETEAQKALDDLASSGFSRNDMYINAASAASSVGSTDTASDHESIGDRIKTFFHNLFSGEDTANAGVYSEAVERGGYVLTVMARDDQQVAQATEVLNRHDPVDMEEREAQWKNTGWSPQTSTASETSDRTTALGTASSGAGVSADSVAGESVAEPEPNRESQTIPVVEEELQVGKRRVQRGGVRVMQRVSEKPVQESVQLHDERVTIERHPVNQPASAAGADAWREGTVEVRETVEEPVVGKTARVVEEVVIGKESRDRTETIEDTVRRTDVEVEPLTGQAAGSSQSGMDDSDFRSHWQRSYSQSGGRYEDYAPAYQYGSALGTDERYRGQRWDVIEPQIRADWEAAHTDNPWEKTKEAVRAGWEKMTR